MRAGLNGGFVFAALAAAGGTGCMAAVGEENLAESKLGLSNGVTRTNAFGAADYFSETELIDDNPATNPFFRDLGINRRTCNSCHKLEDGMGISTATINAAFNATAAGGQATLDPIFRLN